jgi:carotenoid cleavage dioxygenase
VLSDEGVVVREATIPVDHGPSIHDCALTERFAVVLDRPVTLSLTALIGGHSFPYRWNPAHRARVGLLPRNGAAQDIIWCDVEPCYVFHVANAFEGEGGRVVMDVVAYDTMFANSEQGPDSASRFERWTLDPAARTVQRKVIDPSAQEFPRMDERRYGRPYRYAYAVALEADNLQFGGGTALYKHDLTTGRRLVHEFGPQRFPGEFVFTPASPEAAEDEGWLIGLVINMNDATTDLAILDAQRFEDQPIASVRIPHRIPPGFHGNWIRRATVAACRPGSPPQSGGEAFSSQENAGS